MFPLVGNVTSICALMLIGSTMSFLITWKTLLRNVKHCNSYNLIHKNKIEFSFTVFYVLLNKLSFPKCSSKDLIVDHKQVGRKSLWESTMKAVRWKKPYTNNSSDDKHLYHPTKREIVKFQIDDSGRALYRVVTNNNKSRMISFPAPNPSPEYFQFNLLQLYLN